MLFFIFLSQKKVSDSLTLRLEQNRLLKQLYLFPRNYLQSEFDPGYFLPVNYEESNIPSPAELSANISLNLIIHGFLSVFLGFACRRELVMGYGAISLQIASRKLP